LEDILKMHGLKSEQLHPLDGSGSLVRKP